MSVSYLKVICAWSWGYIEAFGDLRSAKNKLTATLFLIHNQMNHPVDHLYNLKIIFLFLFQLAPCVNYPTEKFSSYEECDTSFIRNVTKSLGVTPFWVTNGYSEVTTHAVPKNAGKFVDTIWGLFDGTTEPKCHRPCKYIFWYFIYRLLVNQDKPWCLSTWFSFRLMLLAKIYSIKFWLCGKSNGNCVLNIAFYQPQI